MDILTQANNLLDLYTPVTTERDEEFIIPLLRSLLEYAPSPEGRHNVCTEIAGCVDDAGRVDSNKIRELALRYQSGLLIPSKCESFVVSVRFCFIRWFAVRAPGGKPPEVTSHPSVGSVDFKEDVNEGLLASARRNSGTLKNLVGLF